MKVHFKETIWYEVQVPEGKEEEALRLIKSGEITTAEELMNEYDIYNGEYAKDTYEQMAPEVNDNQATIEVTENSIITYQNGK